MRDKFFKEQVSFIDLRHPAIVKYNTPTIHVEYNPTTDSVSVIPELKDGMPNTIYTNIIQNYFHNIIPEDILSGAADSILPCDRTAELVICSDTLQTAVNSYNSLIQRGYFNIHVAHLQAVINALTRN